MSMFNNLVVTDHAKTAQNEIVKHLKSLGYKCVSEYEVDNRGDGRVGRIDIVATKDDIKLAIEVDNKSPRQKSINKLNSMTNYHKIVILRNGNGNYRLGDIYVVSIRSEKL